MRLAEAKVGVADEPSQQETPGCSARSPRPIRKWNFGESVDVAWKWVARNRTKESLASTCPKTFAYQHPAWQPLWGFALSARVIEWKKGPTRQLGPTRGVSDYLPPTSEDQSRQQHVSDPQSLHPLRALFSHLQQVSKLLEVAKSRPMVRRSQLR